MKKQGLQVVLSIAAGFGISAFFISRFFGYYADYSFANRSFLHFVPAIAVAICFYFSFPFLEKIYINSKTVLENTDKQQSFRFVFGWLLSVFGSYLTLGILDNFYTNPLDIIILVLLTQLLGGLFGYYLVGQLIRNNYNFSFIIGLLLFFSLAGFAASIFRTGNQLPALFAASSFTLNPGFRSLFLIFSLLMLPFQVLGYQTLKSTQMTSKIKATKIFGFVEQNLEGILLAGMFFYIYLLIASMLNHPRFDVDDVFFDADPFNWRLRLTTDNWHDYYWRSVHPFVLLLLKPPIDFIGMLLKGDKLFGAFIVIAMAGALCVFVVWRYINKVSENTAYALLAASLLGLSTSHLIFGSLIETYVFLAASLLVFQLLLLEESPFSALVISGLSTIGLTYTNFAQNVLALFTIKPNFKLIFRFISTVLVFLVLLSLANNLLYPESQPFFFVPSALQAEEQNIFPLNRLRIDALIKLFFFQNVVAPTPILYTKDIPFTQFRFFKPEINALSDYDPGLQMVTALFWLGLIILAIIAFLINFKGYKTHKYSTALAGCIAINFGLHLRYGKELFLYSPNWTYALILILALAWQGFAKFRWFQVTLLFFLTLLMFNNDFLLKSIFEILASQIN